MNWRPPTRKSRGDQLRNNQKKIAGRYKMTTKAKNRSEWKEIGEVGRKMKKKDNNESELNNQK